MPRVVENEKNPLVSKGIFRMAPATGLEPVTVRLTDRILRESLDFMLWEVEIDDDFSFEAADSQ